MPEALSTPPAIPDYELVRQVGSGSYGDVWLARSLTGVYRAIKIVWRARFTEAHPYEREFKGLREFARISLEESAQLALLHVGRNDAAGFFYYVMELADDVETGREINPDNYTPLTLRELRARRGRLPAAELTRLAVDLARALAGLHGRNLVHRDIKPANIILVGGTPKLADIGLVTATTAALTFVGTEGFVPPEGPGTPAADIYSFGKMLYELATGFDRNDYPRLPAELHRWPDRRELMELNEIIIRACETDTRRRYADAAAILEELLLAQAGRSVRRLRLTERGLARARRVAAGVLLIAAVAGLGAYVEHQRAERESAGRRAAEAERDLLARKTVYSATLARAQRALELNAHGQARRLLRELVPAAGAHDLRGFEWHALWHEAQGDPAEVIREEGPTIERTAFSPDGRFLAVHDNAKTVTLHDAATRAPLRSFGGVHRLAGFSPDGRWLVGTTPDFALQRWSVADSQPEGPPQSGGINRPMGVLPNGQLVVFTDGKPDGPPHVVRIWDFEQKAEVTRFTVAADKPERWDFFRSAVSADGRRLALALVSGRSQTSRWFLQIRELPTGTVLHEEPSQEWITAFAFSADGTLLASALSSTGEIQLRDEISQRLLWRKRGSVGEIRSLAFSDDAKQLAVGGHNSVVTLLDCSDGVVKTQLRGQAGGIEQLAWAPDKHSVVSSGSAGDLRQWPLSTGKKRYDLSGLWRPAGGGRTLALSPDGEILALCSDGYKTQLFSTSSLISLADLPGLIKPLAFSDDGAELIGISVHNRLQHWRWHESVLASELPLADESATVRVTYWTALAKTWAVGDSTGRLHIGRWPATRSGSSDITFLRTIFLRTIDSVSALALAPDGRRAFTGSNSIDHGTIWETTTGVPLATWPTPQPIRDIAVSPDARLIAVGLENGKIELRTGEPQRLEHTLTTGDSVIGAVVFSPDGSRLICGGSDSTLHLFDTSDWREVATFTARTSGSQSGDTKVAALTMSADGSTLAAYLSDGRLRLWKTQ